VFSSRVEKLPVLQPDPGDETVEVKHNAFSEREKVEGKIQMHDVVRSPIDHATKKTEIIELLHHIHEDWCQSCYAILEDYEWPPPKKPRAVLVLKD